MIVSVVLASTSPALRRRRECTPESKATRCLVRCQASAQLRQTTDTPHLPPTSRTGPVPRNGRAGLCWSEALPTWRQSPRTSADWEVRPGVDPSSETMALIDLLALELRQAAACLFTTPTTHTPG